MLGSSHLGAQHLTQVILLNDVLLNVTTSSAVVCKQMGCEAQPWTSPEKRQCGMCLISLGKHILAVSNTYFFKKK